MKNNKIYILSSAVGVAGGADKATKLLAKTYNELGFRTTIFATSCEVKADKNDIRIIGPIINFGHRWKIPHLSLILRLFLFSIIQRPKLIHCVGLTYEVKLALTYLKYQNIIVWETTEADKGNRFVYPGIIPKLKHAKLMLAPSQTIKKNIVKNYCFNGRILLLPFWTEWQINQIRHKKRTGRILYVGRLDEDKGFACFFDALRIIKNKENIKVDICGRGNINLIKRLASDIPNVKIHGFVDSSQIKLLYNDADFIILPSKHEGYPLSLIEACGKAIPIIASKVGSIPEVYQNSRAALLFNSGDSKELSESIMAAYKESDEHYNERRYLARKLYEDINNMENIKLRLNEIINYVEVLDNHFKN